VTGVTRLGDETLAVPAPQIFLANSGAQQIEFLRVILWIDVGEGFKICQNFGDLATDRGTPCDGVPAQILDPANTWPSREEYFNKYDALAARFIENFKLMVAECPEHIRESGPKRLATATAGSLGKHR